MAPAGQTITAAAAHHVTFAAHQIAYVKIGDVRPQLDNLSDKFVADRHRHRNGALRPFIPVVDVNVGTANAGATHANQNIVDADARLRNLFEPQTGLALALYEGFHEPLIPT